MAKRRMEKPIKSFGFDSTKGIDQKLLSLVNTYSAMIPGIPTLSLIRNLLINSLSRAIADKQSEQKPAKTA